MRTALAAALAGCLFTAQLSAQEGSGVVVETADEASGVAVVVTPEATGQALVVRDAKGKVVDRIESPQPATVYEYRLEPGKYRVRAPGQTVPAEVRLQAGQVYVFAIGKPQPETDAQAYMRGTVSERESGQPAGNELIFSLDPKRGTDDPGPMAPQ